MVNIKLSDNDKNNLLEFLEANAQQITPDQIGLIKEKLDAKISLLQSNNKLPDYAREMIPQIEALATILNSASLPAYKHNRVLAALHYFVLIEDIIPDYIPLVGFLDDAFIISSVFEEVKDEILMEIK